MTEDVKIGTVEKLCCKAVRENAKSAAFKRRIVLIYGDFTSTIFINLNNYL